MSIESMKRIMESEDATVSIRKQAQADARQTLEQGRKQAEDLTEAAKKQADANYRTAMTEAEQKASALYEEKMSAVMAECERMKASAAEHVPEAVEMILGKVVNASVNC